MHIIGIGSGFRNIADAVERAASVKLTYRNYVFAAMQRGGGSSRQDVACFTVATAFFLILAVANLWVHARIF